MPLEGVDAEGPSGLDLAVGWIGLVAIRPHLEIAGALRLGIADGDRTGRTCHPRHRTVVEPPVEPAFARIAGHDLGVEHDVVPTADRSVAPELDDRNVLL